MTFTASLFGCRRVSNLIRVLAGLCLSGITGTTAAESPETTAAAAASAAIAAAPLTTPLAPAGTATANKLTDTYKIQPQDILVVDVVNEPLIGPKELRVSAQGEISFPYIGTLRVVDRTPADVQEEVKRLLEADYLVNAQVIAQVKEYRKRTVMVIGQVNRPGEVQIPPEGKLTVIEAIGFANGYTRYARKSDIEVSKKGQKSVRCSDDEQRNSPDKVLYLEHGDVVFVHESRI
jgi:polysaccharide export outer membrane protein